MHYILNPNVALRSWWLVPDAYYIRGQRNAQGLKKEELEFLTACDGKTELPSCKDSTLAATLLRRNLIFEAPAGFEAQAGSTVSEWSRLRVCDNRYFPAMNWMITGKCNYNCLHCFNAADNAPLIQEWSLPEAEKLLDEAEKCGINAFTITGGEPMCHKDFFPIMEGIYRRGMYVEELNTNGFYLTPETLERMCEIGCTPLIKISFDGLGYHDWMRNRSGAEQDALRAIRLCVQKGFRVKVQTNVNRKNIDSMLPTARLLDSIGVEEMRIIRTTEAPRWIQNASGMTLELSEYYDRMFEFAQDYAKADGNMVVDIWQVMTLRPRQRAYRLRVVECGIGEYRESLAVCRGNRGMVAVAANGNVFPCMQMSGYYEANHDILGNAKTDGLQKLLQDSRYLSEVCTTLGELAAVNSKCSRCAYFKHCAGGCRAIALALTGDKLGIDPAKCLFFEKGYHERAEKLLPGWTNLSPMEKDIH